MLYKESGVNIDDAYRGIEGIKNELGENFGSFAGLFRLDSVIKDYKKPILVSSTDGVGTKVMLLKKYERYRTLAQDLVAMNLNDLVCLGAKPLFFLDYYSTGKLNQKNFKEFLKHLVDILKEFEIHACAHITGGGIVDNISRVVPKNMVAVIEKNSWNIPNLFRIIQKAGNIPESEIYRVFNMGVGFVMIIPQKIEEKLKDYLRKLGEDSFIIGRIEKVNDSKKYEENNRVWLR